MPNEEIKRVFADMIQKRQEEKNELLSTGADLADIVEETTIKTIVDMLCWAGNHRVRLMSVQPSNAEEGKPPQAQITIEPVTEENW